MPVCVELLDGDRTFPGLWRLPRSGAVGPCGAAGGPSARRGGGARVSLRVGICSSALPAENARFVRHGHSWSSLGEGAMERAGLCRGSWPLCCLQHSCFLVSGRSPRTQLLHPSSSRKLWGLQDLVSKLSVYWDLGGLLITPGLVIPGVPALVSTAEFAGVFWWDWDPAQPQRPALLCFVGTKAAVGAGHPRLCQHGPLPAHRAGQPGSPAPSVAGNGQCGEKGATGAHRMPLPLQLKLFLTGKSWSCCSESLPAFLVLKESGH